jgi:hypothetical protein
MATASNLGGVEDEARRSGRFSFSFFFLLSSFFFHLSSFFILHSSFILYPTSVAGKNFGLPVSAVSSNVTGPTPLPTRSLSTMTGKAPEKNPG